MVDNDVILAKINNVQNSLERIQMTSMPPHTDLLENYDVQDIVVLNLQRAIQSIMDMAAHVVSALDLGLPASQKELFLLLEKKKIIAHRLSQSMQKMVGFRNIAVREYSTLDPHILVSILERDLCGLEQFYSAIAHHFKIDGGAEK